MRLHALQSIVVSGAISVLQIVLTITMVGVFLLPFVAILGLVLWILCMVKAYQGEKFKLPIAGDIAEKHA